MIKKKNLKKVIPILFMSSAFSFYSAPPASAQRLGEDVPITAEFKDTTIVDTLDALSRLSGIPIVINGSLTDKVTINANGQPLTNIIDNIVNAFNLTCTEKNGMIVVSENDKKSNKMTQTFNVQYMDMDELKASIQTFADSENISTSVINNTLTVTGNAEVLNKVQELLNAQDVKQQQVTLQVKFVEITKGEAENLGINFKNANWGTFSKVIGKTTPFKGVYDAELLGSAKDNSGKVISRPTVSTMNGKKATINLSDRVPILKTTTSNGDTTTSVDYEDVGIQMDVTPRINSKNGDVTMEISPKVSTITGWTENKNVSAPQIATREVSTNIRCKSGDTIIIGGLIKQDDIQSLSKVPILGDLPLLGKLFQYKQHQKNETELVVMITPVIEGFEDNPMESEFLKEEKNPNNIRNKDTIDHIKHTDRRGQDNRTTGRI